MSESLIVRSRLGSHRRAKDYYRKRTGPSILVLQPIEESPVPGISRIVPIMVGAAEAAQLHLAVTHTKVARPTTHDLLLDALTNLDASVDHVLSTR